MSESAPNTNQFLKLNNGQQIPVIGLGTAKHKDNFGEMVTNAVKTAVEAGYRFIDTALEYRNEPDIGIAIEELINTGKVKRDELFISSKLWSTHHKAKRVREALLTTLRDLKVDYLDLYLIHWPIALKPGAPYPHGEACCYEDIDTVETWSAMEELVKEGLVKSIGVSNFNSKQLQRILDHCQIKPVMNQIEVHPYLNNRKLVDYCQQRGVDVTAFSPFASADKGRYNYLESDPRPLEDPVIACIGNKYGKTAAQVILRWIIQRNICVIPKSSTPSRIWENQQVFDFQLSEDDHAAMEELNRDHRIIDGFQNDPYNYPFHEEF